MNVFAKDGASMSLDSSGNRLIVKGREETLSQIEKLVKELDQPPPLSQPVPLRP